MFLSVEIVIRNILVLTQIQMKKDEENGSKYLNNRLRYYYEILDEHSSYPFRGKDVSFVYVLFFKIYVT